MRRYYIQESFSGRRWLVDVQDGGGNKKAGEAACRFFRTLHTLHDSSVSIKPATDADEVKMELDPVTGIHGVVAAKQIAERAA